MFLQWDVRSSVLKTPKNTKTRETKTQITQFFENVWPIQGGTLRKLTSWGFRKCCRFWVLKVLNLSYWLSKSGQIWKKKIPWERGEQKITTNFEFWCVTRMAGPSQMVGGTCYSCQTSKLKIGRVLFFTPPYFRGGTSFFGLIRPSLTAYNSRSKPHIFSESTGGEVSHGPILDIFFFEQISRNERFMAKVDF